MIDKDREDGDDAGLILTPEHRTALLNESPKPEPFIRRLYGGNEFINGIERWCLWLVGAPPTLLRESPLLRLASTGVRAFREKVVESRPASSQPHQHCSGKFGSQPAPTC